VPFIECQIWNKTFEKVRQIGQIYGQPIEKMAFSGIGMPEQKPKGSFPFLLPVLFPSSSKFTLVVLFSPLLQCLRTKGMQISLLALIPSAHIWPNPLLLPFIPSFYPPMAMAIMQIARAASFVPISPLPSQPCFCLYNELLEWKWKLKR
jgi:hypothetical protein